MLNAYEHEDADELTKSVETVVDPVRELIARARDEGVDVIYVNDNYLGILYSALDAYVRHLDVSIPRDGWRTSTRASPAPRWR